MKFVRQGRAYQLTLKNGVDLRDAMDLDIALWVAMSAPKNAFFCDGEFLELLNNGRGAYITTENVRAGIDWLLKCLPKHEEITADFSGAIKLSDISSDETGKELVSSAKYILAELSKPEQEEITLDEVREFQNIVKNRPLNGDGILSVNSASVCSDNAKCQRLAQFIELAAQATGGTPDADGTTGVSEAQCKDFWNAIPEYLDWLKQAAIPAGAEKTDIMVFGADTQARTDLFDRYDGKIRAFFSLCKAIAFDGRLASKGLCREDRAGEFDPLNADALEEYLEGMPIAEANPDGIFPLDIARINPKYQTSWMQVVDDLVKPILGNDIKVLTEADWNAVAAYLMPYRDYLARLKGAICRGMDAAVLAEFAADDSLMELSADLFARDVLVAQTLKRGQEVERLLLYRQWMIRFVNNFISFSDLYSNDGQALFERGSIVIDGRWFNAVFPVNDLARHSAVASQGSLFVAYFKVIFDDGSTKTVAAPVTVGRKCGLEVGKCGVFFDTDAKQYPVEVIKIIENPVCLFEALVAPFAKIGKMVEGKVENWSNKAEGSFEGKVGGVINDPSAVVNTAATPAKDKGNMLMGAGIAFAALGSAVAFISKTLASMSGLAITISVICVLLALMLPISIMVMIKLRRQDLSTMLEGNGWAINSRMRLTGRLRRHFSRHGKYPDSALGTPAKRLRHGIAVVIWLVIIALAVCFAVYRWKHACDACECPAVDSVACQTVTTPENVDSIDGSAAPEPVLVENVDNAE